MEKKYIVSEEALPKGLLGVCQAWSLIKNGTVRSISDAVKVVGISRSAYYKYRDKIKPYDKTESDGVFVVQAVLTNRAGVLSDFLNVFARANANVITVNQNLPVNGEAGVVITASNAGLKISREMLIRRLCALEGIKSAEIILG